MLLLFKNSKTNPHMVSNVRIATEKAKVSRPWALVLKTWNYTSCSPSSFVLVLMVSLQLEEGWTQQNLHPHGASTTYQSGTHSIPGIAALFYSMSRALVLEPMAVLMIPKSDPFSLLSLFLVLERRKQGFVLDSKFRKKKSEIKWCLEEWITLIFISL